MTNTLLFIGILLFFIYALYDQFGMDKLKGKTLLKIQLQKQAKIDGLIFIGLILLVIYQGIHHINAISLYLLTTLIMLCIYGAFIRHPSFLLKPTGFFFGNFFVPYQHIHSINLTENSILVIDLKSGKRLLVRIANPNDLTKIIEKLTALHVINPESEQTLKKILSK
ncbi:DUF986 family protein [Conservatibacter flavescens]|uniref:UPF0266 membrane protein CVP05_07095 n=1 Tax=Conservatibacter flavescens TaxID=28161 RepID=A0A2M8S2A3_9PAST|nr:DUF986 family protein [Conservatibacter flavescens]PJG85254.1 hypothetical protein CVP05_07095 [Conservatibacter flavescens]